MAGCTGGVEMASLAWKRPSKGQNVLSEVVNSPPKLKEIRGALSLLIPSTWLVVAPAKPVGVFSRH